MSDSFAPEAHPSHVPVLITLACANLTAALGASLVSVMLPAFTLRFSATIAQVQWVVLAYLLAVTLTVVTAGRLGDLLGPRRVLLAGWGVFLLASISAALTSGLVPLVLARAAQGAGAAIMIALSMSLARDLIPVERLGLAMGLLGTTSAIGTALGPAVGGMLMAFGDWPLAFWMLAVVSAATLCLSFNTLPKDANRADMRLCDLDLPATLVLMITLASYGLATIRGANLGAIPQGALVAIALAGGLLFVGLERRAPLPLVPVALLRQRSVGAGVAMNLLVATVMMSTLVVGPFFLSFALGLKVALVGAVLAVGPDVAALSGLPAGRLTDRFGAARVMIAGLVLVLLGVLSLALLPRAFGLSGYIAALFILTPGFQLFLAANNTAVLMRADAGDRGRLSGLLGVSRNLGLMTGASAMPAVFAKSLGKEPLEHATQAEIATAFTMTFLTAAALVVLALGLAFCVLERGAEETPHVQ